MAAGPDRSDAPLLAVVPVRAGSRGVRAKALQPVRGVPLLLHTLATIRNAAVADKIVVTTNDPTVASIARLHGIEVIDRPEALCGPEVPLGPVVRHAVAHLAWPGLVAVFQATCPLLQARTVQECVGEFRRAEVEWAITASNHPHLLWADGVPVAPRMNRQLLATHPACPKQESGALALYTQEALRDEGWAGTTLTIPAEEALDIDTWADLTAARQALGRQGILFRVRVGTQVGSGHLYRAIALAEAMGHHEVGISPVAVNADEMPMWALEMLDVRGLWWEGCESVFADHAGLVILDVLDTTSTLVARYKAKDKVVVTFEDEGPGRMLADLTVNELLPDEYDDNPSLLTGPAYAVIRPEFLNLRYRDICPVATRILVSFGGTDPAGLNGRVAELLAGRYDVRVMGGPAAPGGGVGMAEQMNWADVLVTSQGRTQYEAAAMGLPTITIAANERESRHVRCPGHLHLGLHAALMGAQVEGAVERVAGDAALRKEMSRTARGAVDGRGVERIVWQLDGLLGGLR